MGRNVEIKARLDDVEAVRKRARELSGAEPEQLQQRDTFFSVARGRLKLREFADGSAELIAYERPDEAGPKLSSYGVYPATAPQALLAALSLAPGIRGVVTKQREVFLVGQTRVHVDRVAGLGAFVELEVVLRDAQTLADGERIARELLAQLGVNRSALVSGAYIDLIEMVRSTDGCLSGCSTED